jgi:hypothetical protein
MSASSQATNKFSGSVAGTMKSLFSSSARTFFILEHKSQSQRYPIGKTEHFISDYVELGRGSHFAVGFGNDCPTVSRPHAAIIRQGKGWILRPISRSNVTLVNNQVITTDTALKNGDLLQLSANGPKMVFLAAANNTIDTLNFGQRFNALNREVLKPFKIVIAVLCLFMFGGAATVVWLVGKNTDQERRLANSENQSARLVAKLDSLSKVPPPKPPPHPPSPPPPPAVEPLFSGIYYIQSVTVMVNGEEKGSLHLAGTGFLLNDGRLVKARHVVLPWIYSPTRSEYFKVLNALYTQQPAQVVHHLVAVNALDPNKVIHFSSAQMQLDNSKDEVRQLEVEGAPHKIQFAPGLAGPDWATFDTGVKGQGLRSGAKAACGLTVASKVFALGYPGGAVAKMADLQKPIYGPLTISRPKCHEGAIWITDRNIEPGFSGGPVLRLNPQNQYEVVGIVSGGQAATQGLLTPLSHINRAPTD